MKKLFLVLLSLFILFSVKAKELELRKIYVDGTEEVLLLDDNTDTIVLYSSDANSKEVKDIIGLNQFKNLKILDIPMLRYNGDWQFLAGLTTVRILGFSSDSEKLKSIKFLESLTSLETLDCKLLIREEYKDFFLSEKIDLRNLKNLKNIYYKCRIWKNDSSGWYYLGRIPNFINVKNKPILDLNNNGIEYLTSREKKMLKQYSEVNFYSNPITNNKKTK